MPNTNLSFPVYVKEIVEEEKKSFLLFPFFMGFPDVFAQEYDKALKLLKKIVRRKFTDYVVRRETVDDLLWFRFSPDLNFRLIPLEFTARKRWISGQFAAATFRLNNHHFAYFPLFENLLFLPPKLPNKEIWETIIPNQIQELIKKQQYIEGEEFDPFRYKSGSRDFITQVELRVFVQDGPFSFKAERRHSQFNAFFSDEGFDGAEEIYKVGFDLSEKYPYDLKKAFFREEEINQLYPILFGQKVIPLAILGENGVGRHTLVEECLRRYLESSPNAQKKSFWHIYPNKVIAGMSIVGHWQKRTEAIIDYVHAGTGRNETLLFDNPVSLLSIGQSSQNKLALADVLKTYLENRSLRLVLIASPDEWKVIQEKDRRFAELFQIIRVQEPSEELALKMAMSVRNVVENRFHVEIDVMAIRELYGLYQKYNGQNLALPGALISPMTHLANKYQHQEIGSDDVTSSFSQSNSLRWEIFDDAVQLLPEFVENELQAKLIGQPHVIEALANLVHRIKAQVTRPGKPFASYLFIGPTGVGKTQAVKVLHQFISTSPSSLLRFDMNEYKDPWSVTRLIGSAHEEGLLTAKVNQTPFAVLLFDEIEKAHPNVWDMLLQVLDDGRLTDGKAKTTSFANTVIILTSNLGAIGANQQLGFSYSEAEVSARYLNSLQKTFRPEFINRFDKILVFKHLTLPDIRRIARLQIRELLQRDGFVRRTTIVKVSENAIDFVSDRGYDRSMGGRALKRQIEKDLTALSADQLLDIDPNLPILLEINLADGRLFPQITSISFSDPNKKDWLPRVPGTKNAGRFIGQLIRELEIEEQNLRNWHHQQAQTTEVETKEWRFYHLIEQLANLKETLNTLLLGFRDNNFSVAPAIPLRIKRISTSTATLKNEKGYRNHRAQLRDKFFQKEGLEELRQQLFYSPALFDRMETELLNSYLQVFFSKRFARGYLQQKYDKGKLSVVPVTDIQHPDQLEYLLNRFRAIMDLFDIPHQDGQIPGTLLFEGFGSYPLFLPETGLHLFYITGNIPILLEVRLQRQGAPAHEVAFKNTILRVYDQRNNIMDMRSGLSVALDVSAHELLLLLYAGHQSTTGN